MLCRNDGDDNEKNAMASTAVASSYAVSDVNEGRGGEVFRNWSAEQVGGIC